MSVNTYDIGDRVRVSTTFTVSGVATDPTTITLKVLAPDATTTTYTYAGSTISRSATGAYYKDIDVTLHGNYYYYWAGTGTAVGAEEGLFRVKLSAVVTG